MAHRAQLHEKKLLERREVSQKQRCSIAEAESEMTHAERDRIQGPVGSLSGKWQCTVKAIRELPWGGRESCITRLEKTWTDSSRDGQGNQTHGMICEF